MLELPSHTLYPLAGLMAAALTHLSCPSLRRVVAFTSTSIVTKAESEIDAERESVRRWAAAEQQLIVACERLGIQWTVLRPTIIYDEGRDANLTRLSRLIERFGFMPLAGSGTGLRQPVHAEDLAAGAAATAASSAAANKIYAIPGRDTITYREMVGRIFDGMDRRRRIVAIPPRCGGGIRFGQTIHLNANVAMGNQMAKDMILMLPAMGFRLNPRVSSEVRATPDRNAMPC